MAWLYVPGLPELTSPSPLQCPDTELSVQLRGKPLPPQRWLRASKTAPSLRFLSGIQSSPSMVNRGVDSWISSIQACHVSRGPWQASNSGSKTSGGFGMTCTESSERSILPSSLLRMCLGLFEVDFTPSSMTLPPAGGMQNGCIYERPMWEPRTNVKESLCSGGAASWPTPVANDDNKTPEAHLAMKRRMGERDGSNANRTAITSLQVFTQAWPTPTATDSTSTANATAGRSDPNSNHHAGTTLTDAIRLWRTPSAGHPDKGGSQSPEKRLAGGHTLDLQDQAEYWMTPNVPTGGRVLPEADVIAKGATDQGKRQVGLEMQCRYWRTPDSRDHHAQGPREQHEQRQTKLSDQIKSFLPDQMTQTNGSESLQSTRTSRRRLNPAFVCWLMTWPWWWTQPVPINFAREAMALWQSKARLHLSNLLEGRA